METSNNIISRMSNWHSTAVSQARTAELEAKKAAQEAQEAANKKLYEKSLDSFTTNFETLSQLDGKNGDYDSRPGNVRTSTKSLQKTAKGFVMTLLTYQPAPGLGAVFPGVGGAFLGGGKPLTKMLETYTVDEKNNTVSYTKMKESPFSAAGISRADLRGEEHPLGQNPVVEQTYLIDLKSGTIADLTPAALTGREPRENSRANGVL
jgi:hypothetical protein